jgi:hypothetical protein
VSSSARPRRVRGTIERLGIGPGSVVSQIAAPGSGMMIIETLLALVSGGCSS